MDRSHFAPRFALLFLFTLGALNLGVAESQTLPSLRVLDAGEQRIRVDGSMRDWGRVELRWFGDENASHFGCALAHTDSDLYVVARVTDERLIRTRGLNSENDALVLRLGWVEGNNSRGLDVWLLPGVPGRIAAVGGTGRPGARPRENGRIEVVEAPLQGEGYVIEARIPLEVLGGANALEGARLAIQFNDVDSESRPRAIRVPQVLSSRPEELPELFVQGGSAEALRSFQADHDLLHARPRFELRGQVRGDRREERVAIVGDHVVVTGPSIGDGRGYAYFSLPIRSSRDVLNAYLRDLTGDGRQEAVIQLRQERGGAVRTVQWVLGLAGERILPLFRAEVSYENGGESLRAEWRELRPSRRGEPRRVQLRTTQSGQGVRLGAFGAAREVPGISLVRPWGNFASRIYEWNGTEFVVAEETLLASTAPQPARAAEARAARPARTSRQPASPPAAPAAPSARQLLQAARTAQGVGRGRAAHRFEMNLAEDPRPEVAEIVGTSLLVVGQGFRGGQGYFVWGVPVESPDDLLGAWATDLTGDGRAELLFRVRQRVGEIEREILLVHQFRPRSFTRILALEVARQLGDQRIANEVVLPSRRNRRGLRVRPGRARGWDQSNWRFADEGSDGVVPLLLPWRDDEVRFQYRDGALRADR